VNLAVGKGGKVILINITPLFCDIKVSIVVIEMFVTFRTETETVRGEAAMKVFGSIFFRGIVEIARDIRSM